MSPLCLPATDLILTGFRKRKGLKSEEPTVNFRALQELLEFLEFVVLSERLVISVPALSPKIERIASARSLEMDFARFRIRGDLEYETAQLVDTLYDAGVLVEARISGSHATADGVIDSLLPGSPVLRADLRARVKTASTHKRYSQQAIGQATLAVHIGLPLHIAYTATDARVPYVLSPAEAWDLRTLEVETTNLRSSVSTLLLERLNRGARKELEQLTALSLPAAFPETPIASRILDESTSVSTMVNTALELRREFADFRRSINEIEATIADPNASVSVRKKALRDVERMAASLWPEERTDFGKVALSVGESLMEVPDFAAAPSPKKAVEIAGKLGKSSFESILSFLRRRRVRLLLKARRTFLNSRNSSQKVSRLLDVPVEIVDRSRRRPRSLHGRRPVINGDD